MQLLGKFRQGTLAIYRHISDYIALDNVILMCNALNVLAGLNVKKLGK